MSEDAFTAVPSLAIFLTTSPGSAPGAALEGNSRNPHFMKAVELLSFELDVTAKASNGPDQVETDQPDFKDFCFSHFANSPAAAKFFELTLSRTPMQDLTISFASVGSSTVQWKIAFTQVIFTRSKISSSYAGEFKQDVCFTARLVEYYVPGSSFNSQTDYPSVSTDFVGYDLMRALML